MESPPPRTTESSPRLLRASQEGDREALAELLRRHLPGVRAFVRLRMGPLLRARESGSDLVQSVCADLFSARGVAFADEPAFRGWLYAAALHKLRNHERHFLAQKRDAGREQPLVTGSGSAADGDLEQCYATVLSPSRVAIARERIARLEQAFDDLPEHYREVVTLARVAGLTYEQIAEATGRTADSVRNVLARALNRLAELLDDGG
jgi:RNA polymerase sigma-70 factor (ECF subfamily)